MTAHKGGVFICNTCLQAFQTDRVFGTHKKECGRIITEMVNVDNNILKFKNYERQMDVPFVVYADFECILTSENNSLSSGVQNVQRHIPCAFSYYIKCNYNNNLDKLVVYSGENVAETFVKQLIDDIHYIYKTHLSQNVRISMTPCDKLAFYQAQLCHICDGEFNNDKVMDHCHLTGVYRGAAHNSCNLNFQIPSFIPILFHNFTSYDCHLFIEKLSSVPGDIKVIPLNKEKYISLSKYITVDENSQIEMRFLDSFRFMASSLESLASNLDSRDFLVTREAYPDCSQFDLVCRKGIFPYNYINNVHRLDEVCLPPIEEFFNTLSDTACSEEDYAHAQNVWRTFGCGTLRDYMELYLKTDVLLLADVFQNFRKICKNIYKLDPCQYYTAPGLSWDAMLRTTKIELELLTDINMYTFVQRGIRGGLVQCSHRHAKANHKYMNDYDASKPSNYLMYLDANNLYGWAMSENLPYGGFEWVENVEDFDLNQLCSSPANGCILEVDLEYPDHLHDKHNDLPFCPKNIKVSNQVKLIADLNIKKNYIILDKNLQQCLTMGLKLVKVHRILQFKQSSWLQKYIDLNTQHRTQAKNAFEKDFFKLLNNSVYGKTMENVDKRKDVKIVTEWESIGRGQRLGARALIARPNFHSVTPISETMLAIQMNRVRTIYNKPLYLGFCVLELSKWKMYDFHYTYMKPKYDDKVVLNYMDTDSFIYTIQTEDFYSDIRNDIPKYFDTSEYSPDNLFNIPLLNKKVLGMMKDENHGNIMREFIGLKSKMYSIDVEKSKTIKKSKGVKKSAVRKLTVDSYRDCLLNKAVLSDSMYTFRSYAHKLYTQKITKIVLSHKDDKRFVCEDGIQTFAWGHYKLKDK